MEEPIRTMREVLDKALEVTDKTELYDLDNELITQFGLETLKGTTPQLMTVIQALRTAALVITCAALDATNSLPQEDPLEETEDDEPVYDA